MEQMRSISGSETAEAECKAGPWSERWQRGQVWLRNALPTLVISVALAATFYGHALLRDRAIDQARAQLRLDSTNLADEMRNRIDRVEYFRTSTTAFYEASETVTREEFASFTGLIHAGADIRGVEYVGYIDAAELAAGSYTPKQAITFNPRRLADALSPPQQPVWHSMINEAAAQRRLVMSPVLPLKDVSGQTSDSGLLVVSPLAQAGSSTVSGYLVLLLDVGPLLAEPLGQWRDHIGMRLFSGMEPDATLVLQRNESAPRAKDLGEIGMISLFGTPWRLETWNLEKALSSDARLANIVLTIGIMVSLALFFASLAQKYARIAADRAQRQLLDALESINDAFAVYDREDRLVVWNSKYVESYPKSGRLIRKHLPYDTLLRAAIRLGDYPDSNHGDSRRIPERQRGQHQSEERLSDGRWLRISENRTSEGGIAVLRSDISASKRHECLLTSQLGILERIMRGGQLDDLLNEVICWLEDNIAASKVSLHRLDTEGRHFAATLSRSLPAAYTDQLAGLEIGPGVGSCGTAAATRLPVISADIAIDPLWNNFRNLVEPFNLRACWSNPIIGETGRVFGTLAVYSERPRQPSATEQQILAIAVNLARLALEREAYLSRLTNLAKMDAVDRLSGGVAHDFNNLLQVVEQSTALLRDMLVNDRQRLLADLTLEAARKGAALTKRLLLFARGQPLQLGGFDLAAAIRELEPLLRQACGKGVALECQSADDLPNINTDRIQLETALLNLAINARDAMPDGGRLTISAKRQDIRETDPVLGLSPGSYACISMTDTGTGMDSETLRNAIVPYFTTKPVGSGSGLGLSMVYGFARETGGALQLQSQPGSGTSVTLYLPFGSG